MSRHVLVLGGTTEARQLAAELAVRPGTRVTTSLAGRVTRPGAVAGGVRVGGFGGAEGLADWLRAHEVAAVVDATH
ncbi:precorrin-6A/cobalt-precorrin-6A reductase, partial [Streptomyces glaucescens]|uniref:precorrin-6A/cobalt-precorrin-6A reductase n=1 Tax=Streptomyces glaucescens TaxID=1907 RepID=UPI00117BF044